MEAAEAKLSSSPEGSSARERGAEESNMTGGGSGDMWGYGMLGTQASVEGEKTKLRLDV